jgi:large subunit ribosomal protein L4
MYLDVKLYLANQRQGTHKAKERAEVSRSTRKLKRQKGTGGARAGSMKSPLFKGGGRIFGPRQRDYGFKLNRKEKALARKSALAVKAKGGVLTVVEDFSFDAPKTKTYAAMLSAFQMLNTKTLLILGDQNQNVLLSGRNIPKVNITAVDQITTYDVLNAERVLVSEGAITKIESLLNK